MVEIMSDEDIVSKTNKGNLNDNLQVSDESKMAPDPTFCNKSNTEDHVWQSRHCSYTTYLLLRIKF